MLPQPRNVPQRWSVFGRRLQELRKANNLSQMELGREFDMTDVQISRLENGKSGTSFENVQALEKRLGAREGDLVGVAFPATESRFLTAEERDLLDTMHRVSERDRSRFISIVKATGQAFATR